MCSPKIDFKVIPIQEKIRKCKKKFNSKTVDCIRCISYTTCKREYLDNIKIPKTSIIHKEGKCPSGKKVKWIDIRDKRDVKPRHNIISIF